ncbi:hypothetical protein BM1_03728 [Bipolaris maydis]|nr:hypothetical protein BM1_03728 [Bipolaris maydis]
MPRKRSYFDGPGRILGTGELVEPKRNVRKVRDAEYIPPKDTESNTENGNHVGDVKGRTEDGEWTPKGKKMKTNQGETKRDEIDKSANKDAGDEKEQCILKEPNDNDAAFAEGQDGGERHECSCSICKKCRGEKED